MTSPETISELESISALRTATNLSLDMLAVLWGNIDTYGDSSLYKKLFLNKAVQPIDTAFMADAFGDYLQDGPIIDPDPLKPELDHQPAILAAFRTTQESLDAILEVATVTDTGTARLLDISKDILNLPNLSTIYRYVVLAKGLNVQVTELCDLIRLLALNPFPTLGRATGEVYGHFAGRYLRVLPTGGGCLTSGFRCR